ncbi:MAG: DNA polymerase ligase N-terminal domain-containing protein [Phycisphaerales bacterium]
MATDDYRRKRDFSRTTEPRGGGRRGKGGDRPIFVIQEHAASTHHFDFRLEVDGVLKSWAVPKGPSTDPREKRLAIPTEDHPMEYADFEGTIPEDAYGGGTVIVWDRGTYDNITEKEGGLVPMAEALRQGHVLVRLNGRKLGGGYALQCTGKGGKARWLLVKMRGEGADARRNPVSTQPESVASGRTVDEVAKEAAGKAN